jgi:molybdopterin-guanine dinucleotide biosynthesis protein A
MAGMAAQPGTSVGTYDAVVLAGGRARRLGGVDKAALEVAGSSSLDRVLDALAGAGTVVVVGPQRPTVRTVVWTREQPRFGGPPAALAAGLVETHAPTVVVLACDAPLVDRPTVSRLVAAASGHDGAWLVDPTGRDQYLVAAYRREALAGVGAAPSLRAAVSGLDIARLVDVTGASQDMDDWDAVADVRSTAAARERPPAP